MNQAVSPGKWFPRLLRLALFWLLAALSVQAEPYRMPDLILQTVPNPVEIRDSETAASQAPSLS